MRDAFRLVAPLTGGATPTRDVAQLRPLVLDLEPQPDDRVAIQITNKWERLGMSLESVVELVRRAATASQLHLLSSSANGNTATRYNARRDSA